LPISFSCNYFILTRSDVNPEKEAIFRMAALNDAGTARRRGKAAAHEAAPRARSTDGTSAKGAGERLDLFLFVPFRLNRLAAEVSAALAAEYQERYGLDIPEWRVLATLGFRREACSAQYISDCTRTHKSTISRAVTTLLKRKVIERVENAADRREFRLQLTRKGRSLYEELIPRLLRREEEILSCLSKREREAFGALLGKIEQRLELVQTSREADAKGAY
jgi:DNA-binding MarR family transcriptional regulator